MFCAQCGERITEGARFCAHCGAAVDKPDETPVPKREGVHARRDSPTQSATTEGGREEQGSARNSAGTAGGSVSGVHAHRASAVEAEFRGERRQAPRSQVASMRGCFGSGWDDVRNSEDYLKRVALMALISMVPVLRWVNIGYGWNWSKGLLNGEHGGLPKGIVNGQNFKIGFFVVVISLLLMLVMGVEGAVLGLFPFLGVFAAIALGVFADMFANLSYLSVAHQDGIGAGFQVSRLFDAFKRNLGTLFCVSFVPNLVAAGISLLVGFAFAFVIGLIAGVDIVSVALSGTRSSRYGAAIPSNLLYALGGSIGVIVLLGLVAAYAEMIVVQFCSLVKQRSVAYYIKRNVPEWSDGAGGDEMSGTSEYEVEDYEETSVLPDYSEEDAETTVKPELKVDFEYGAIAERPKHGREPQAPQASEPVPDPVREPESERLPESKPEPEPAAVPELAREAQRENTAATASDVAPNSSPVAAGASGADAVTVPQPSVQPGSSADGHSQGNVRWGNGPVTLQLARSNGDVCKLTQFPVVIGSSYQVDLVIDDNPAISRTHARVLRDGDMFAVEDLGSTNRTYIGDYELPPFAPTIVSDGDVLKLADEVLRVSVVDW